LTKVTYSDFVYATESQGQKLPGFFNDLFYAKTLSVMRRQIYATLQNIFAIECKYESCIVDMARMQLTTQ